MGRGFWLPRHGLTRPALAVLRWPGHGSRQLMGAVGKNLLFSPGKLSLCRLANGFPQYPGTKMRPKVVLQKLTLSSSRLLDLKPRDIKNKKPSEILLNVLPEKTRESGKPRDYFEQEMLSPENFRELAADESRIYLNLVKKVLDKALMN